MIQPDAEGMKQHFGMSITLNVISGFIQLGYNCLLRRKTAKLI
jgi:hypothetical protein